MKKLSTIALVLVALATFSGLSIAQQKKQMSVPIPAAARVDKNKKPNPPTPVSMAMCIKNDCCNCFKVTGNYYNCICGNNDCKTNKHCTSLVQKIGPAQ